MFYFIFDAHLQAYIIFMYIFDIFLLLFDSNNSIIGRVRFVGIFLTNFYSYQFILLFSINIFRIQQRVKLHLIPMYLRFLLTFCYFMLVQPCFNQLVFIKDVLLENSTQCNCNFTLNSSHMTRTHIIGAETRFDPTSSMNLQYLWLYFPPNKTHAQKYLSLPLAFNTSNYKVRSFKTNTYNYLNNTVNIQGLFLVIIESHQLYILRDTLLTYHLIYVANSSTYNESIEQCIFAGTKENVILLIKSLNGYSLKYISLGLDAANNIIGIINPNQLLIHELDVNISNSEVYLGKIEYNPISNKIFIGFSRSLLCFHATPTLESCGLIRFNWTLWGQIDYSVADNSNDYIAVMGDSSVVIYNFSTFPQSGLWEMKNNLTFTLYCESIKIHFPYLFLSKINAHGLSSVHQLDLENDNFSSLTELYSISFDKMKFNVMMDLMNDNQLLIYHRNSYSGLQLDMMPLILFYNIEKGHCTQNSSFTCQIAQNLNNSAVLKKVCAVVSMFLTVTSMSIIPQFMFTLIIFLDDLWFYKYHNTTYPTQTRIFMENVDVMNKIRLMIASQKGSTKSDDSSSFDNVTDSYDEQIIDIFGAGILSEVLSSTKTKFQMKISTARNTHYGQYLKMNNNLQQTPELIYFLNSLADIQITQVIFNLFYYILFKFVQFILFLFSRKFKMFNSLRKFFRQQTRWWTLVVAIVDANMTRRVFSCLLQAKFFFVFQPQDKAVLAGMTIVLFFSLVYSIIFYSLVYLQQLIFQTKKQKRKILKINTSKVISADKSLNRKLKLTNNRVHHKLDDGEHCLPSSALLKWSCTSSYSVHPYIYESQCIAFRNFLRSFIHAYLIDNYSFQIGCLFLTDVYACYCVLSNRKLHRNTLIFVLFLLYHLVFGVFDFFFFIKETLGMRFSTLISNSGQFSFFTLCFLVIDCLLINFAMIIEWFYMIFKKIWNRFCHVQIIHLDLKKKAIKQEQLKTQKEQNLNTIKVETIGKKQVMKTKTKPRKKVQFQNWKKNHENK